VIEKVTEKGKVVERDGRKTGIAPSAATIIIGNATSVKNVIILVQVTEMREGGHPGISHQANIMTRVLPQLGRMTITGKGIMVLVHLLVLLLMVLRLAHGLLLVLLSLPVHGLPISLISSVIMLWRSLMPTVLFWLIFAMGWRALRSF
jgi:hypothetical protein